MDDSLPPETQDRAAISTPDLKDGGLPPPRIGLVQKIGATNLLIVAAYYYGRRIGETEAS